MRVRLDFLVVHRLLSSVIVILVNLTVDGCRGLLVLCAADSLLLDGGSYSFVDVRIMLAIPGTVACKLELDR